MRMTGAKVLKVGDESRGNCASSALDQGNQISVREIATSRVGFSRALLWLFYCIYCGVVGQMFWEKRCARFAYYKITIISRIHSLYLGAAVHLT